MKTPQLVLIAIVAYLGMLSCDSSESAEGHYENGVLYYFDGSKGEGEMLAGQKKGTWSFWDQNRILSSKGNYHLGKKSGTWTYWFSNGQKMSAGDYQHDLRFGKWYFWYLDGKAKEIRDYRNGQNQLLSSWSRQGEPMVVEGNGPYLYHHQLQLREKGFYKNGIPDSLWLIFDEKGNRIDSFLIEHGHRLPRFSSKGITHQ